MNLLKNINCQNQLITESNNYYIPMKIINNIRKNSAPTIIQNNPNKINLNRVIPNQNRKLNNQVRSL